MAASKRLALVMRLIISYVNYVLLKYDSLRTLFGLEY